MATEKVAQTYRLTETAHRQLRGLAAELGVSQAAVVELATREYWTKIMGGSSTDNARAS